MKPGGTLDHAALSALLDSGAKAKAMRARVARDVAAKANANAPGAHQGTYEARDGEVWATSPWWHLVEYGSVNNVAAAPMRRAAEALLGRRFDRRGK